MIARVEVFVHRYEVTEAGRLALTRCEMPGCKYEAVALAHWPVGPVAVCVTHRVACQLVGDKVTPL